MDKDRCIINQWTVAREIARLCGVHNFSMDTTDDALWSWTSAGRKVVFPSISRDERAKSLDYVSEHYLSKVAKEWTSAQT